MCVVRLYICFIVIVIFNDREVNTSEFLCSTEKNRTSCCAQNGIDTKLPQCANKTWVLASDYTIHKGVLNIKHLEKKTNYHVEVCDTNNNFTSQNLELCTQENCSSPRAENITCHEWKKYTLIKWRKLINITNEANDETTSYNSTDMYGLKLPTQTFWILYKNSTELMETKTKDKNTCPMQINFVGVAMIAELDGNSTLKVEMQPKPISCNNKKQMVNCNITLTFTNRHKGNWTIGNMTFYSEETDCDQNLKSAATINRTSKSDNNNYTKENTTKIEPRTNNSGVKRFKQNTNETQPAKNNSQHSTSKTIKASTTAANSTAATPTRAASARAAPAPPSIRTTIATTNTTTAPPPIPTPTPSTTTTTTATPSTPTLLTIPSTSTAEPTTTTTTTTATPSTPTPLTIPSTSTAAPSTLTAAPSPTTSTPTTPPNSEKDKLHKIGLACLITLMVLAIAFLAYLAYAYAFKKYPFDLRINDISKRVSSLSKEEIAQFSEHYRTTKVKAVRHKAEPPAKESELEVLVTPRDQKPENLSSLPIKVKDFEEYLMTSLGDDPNSNDLTRQYRKLQRTSVKSRSVGLQTQNVDKNRYKNLAAFDHTRVILKNNDNCDYINANYVDGYANTKAFIATQAPLKSTLGDFWCMIWQEKVTFIVMLTELVEDGTVKCEQYWPDLEQKARFGKILISNIAEKTFSDYIDRQFNVQCDNETRLVHHLQYVTWPDHGVPLYPQNFTPFMKKVLTIPQTGSPIVVHCNAGCGRTGTLILCDIVLRMAAKEQVLDFVKILTKMREQRVNQVNNVVQYIFAHFVVLECLFGIDFSIPVNDNFQDEVIRVLRKVTVKPLMYHLDKVMVQFKKRYVCFTTNITDDDKNKNRFSHILPGHAQIFLPMSSEHPANYINAVFVDCYRCPHKFIVTQQPLPNTVEDFWLLIKDNEVNTVVSLNEIDGTDPSCPQFWNWTNGKTKLQILEETDDRAYSTTKLKMFNDNDESFEKTINVIKMKKWKKETPYPSDIKSLIYVWKETFNSSWKGDSQIVVTCYDGATASGLFVALSHLLEKINYEHSCDVFSAIRTIRQSREEFVQEWGQMEFLYKAAKVYIEEFDNYHNFDD